MSPEARLAPLLVRQDGLVTLAQAVDAGVSPRTVHTDWTFARAWLYRTLSAADVH